MLKKHAKRSQRGQRFTAQKFQPYAAALGQLILTWNDLHEELACLYWTLRGYTDTSIKDWNTAKQDRSKRALIKQWAQQQQHALFPQLYYDLAWVLTEVSILAEPRNDATHSPLMWSEQFLFTPAAVSPNTIYENQRTKHLLRKNLLAEFRWHRDSATRLRDFVINMERALSDETTPWPNRPPWPIARPKSTRAIGFRPTHLKKRTSAALTR